VTNTVRHVSLCETQLTALLAAARGCGCGEGEALTAMFADIVYVLEEPLREFGGGDFPGCLVCVYALPDALDNAVCEALAMRDRYGVARKLPETLFRSRNWTSCCNSLPNRPTR
jgi:hypothetical protein